MAITESNVYGLWVAAQTSGKGTAATTAIKRLQQVAGDLDLNREDGSENFSDLGRFGNAVDYVNTIMGEGTPSIHAQPNEVAYLCWLFFGDETFTSAAGTGGSATPPKYVFTPGTNTGLWSTWWKRVGLTQPVRQRFEDCKITSLKIEGSTSNKIVKIMPEVKSITPGLTFATDPSVSPNVTQKPFLYTEATGQFVIDGVTITGQTQFSITIDDGQAPIQADNVTFNDFVAGNASVTMEGPTILLDAKGLEQYNTIVYGTASPSAGTAPIKTTTTGSYVATFTRGTAASRESLKIEVPRIKWSANLAVAPNPDGGAIELPLNGQARKPANGDPIVRISVETGNATGADTAAHTA